MYILVHFAFNKKDDPAGVYALTTFLITIVAVFEFTRWINAKMSNK
jgi:hypothetical protein